MLLRVQRGDLEFVRLRCREENEGTKLMEASSHHFQADEKRKRKENLFRAQPLLLLKCRLFPSRASVLSWPCVNLEAVELECEQRCERDSRLPFIVMQSCNNEWEDWIQLRINRGRNVEITNT